MLVMNVQLFLLLLVGAFDSAFLTMRIFNGNFPVFKKWAERKTGIDKHWWLLGSWHQSTFPRFISKVQTRTEWCWQSYQNVHYWPIFDQFYPFGVWGKPRITPHNKVFHKYRGGRQAKGRHARTVSHINNNLSPSYLLLWRQGPTN